MKELEKKHKVKLSEPAREDILRWMFDLQITREAQQETPKVEEKKQEVK